MKITGSDIILFVCGYTLSAVLFPLITQRAISPLGIALSVIPIIIATFIITKAHFRKKQEKKNEV